MSDIYCSYEGRGFPQAQFRDDRTWGWVHDVDPPHTPAGDLVDETDHSHRVQEFPASAPDEPS